MAISAEGRVGLSTAAGTFRGGRIGRPLATTRYLSALERLLPLTSAVLSCAGGAQAHFWIIRPLARALQRGLQRTPSPDESRKADIKPVPLSMKIGKRRPKPRLGAGVTKSYLRCV